MPLAISDTTYAGEAAGQFIVKSVVGNELVQGGHCYVIDGIKKQYTIPRFQVNNIIQSRISTPISPTSASGTATIDARTLVPADYMIYDEFNPRDYEQHWFATQLNPTLIDRRLPVTIESVVIQEYLKRHNEYLGKAILQSDTSVAGTVPFKYWNGIITRAKLDAAVPKVASPIALAVGGMATAFQSTLSIIAPAVLYDLNLKFFVSYKTAQLWEQEQRTTTYKNVDTTMAGINRFAGRTVVPLFGMPDNAILLGKGTPDLSSNLFVGMNSFDDATVQLQRLQNNSELYYIKMLMKVDANYGFGEQLALYTF
jgi:hypothetical protein